jgi:hypothetical protein
MISNNSVPRIPGRGEDFIRIITIASVAGPSELCSRSQT